METFEVHPKSLKHLLSKIHERELALPDFQRDFVWQPRETEQLVESIAQNFPAGSLLFMGYKPDTFTPRQVQNAPELVADPLELILDGQQRLTSLYQAFYGTGDYRYFINFHHLIEAEADVEEAVFYRHKNRCGAYKERKNQATQLVMPLGDLFGGHEFEGWLDAIMDYRPETGDERVNLRTQLRAARKRYISPIEEYRFPVVTLAQDTSLEAVCSIFETLNRTGVRLSVFELLAARYFAKGLDLRKLWSETRAQLPLVESFDVNDYYVLQAIALRTRRSVKRGDVLNLTVDDIQEHWDAVARGFHEALRMLRDDCGILTAKWLPYNYMLVPMAAVWDRYISVAGPAAGANRARLKQWFWCAALNARYDRAANTQAAKDFTELGRWFDGGVQPEAITEFAFDGGRLSSYTPRQQSVYKALMALVLRRGVLDFHNGQTLTPGSIASGGIDDHHIFPRAYLNPSDGAPTQPVELVDSILNRTMIDRITNIRIGKRPPSDYLSEVRKALSDDGCPASLDQILISHGLPSDDGSPLLADDFERFVEARRGWFVSEIELATERAVGSQHEAVPDELDAVA